jgi:hypothetical protein
MPATCLSASAALARISDLSKSNRIIGGQFDARLGRRLLDRQVLRLTGEVLDRVDQVENLALHLLRPRH